ncbi:hypothetical protein SPHINGO8BC_90059 [Sphingobacterium multivorum]|uniref:Uncharacterized protein n=1 Tax=Sphingobacterium multivorum TaxID=28454 RepID=A0A654DQZ9_SPHMU|nr:hypothetical protein SPHINGO8BC_90059 [Sphingobacterium multivorum]
MNSNFWLANGILFKLFVILFVFLRYPIIVFLYHKDTLYMLWP